jgi:MFS family permease
LSAAPRAEPGRWLIALAGLLALAAAMGIGRFAFTPLLPMMLGEGVVDLPTASWLASANYLGYLVGALFCTFQPWLVRHFPRWPQPAATRWVRGGLVATAVLTLGMALQVPAAWPLLRFAAGVTSALVFVYTSGWCLAQLARHNAPMMGGVIYAGPGAGIALSGLLASAMVALQWRAAVGWLIFGGLAALLTAVVWRVFRDSPGQGATSPPAPVTASLPEVPAGRTQMGWLTLAYGLAGFGYIITATFLPVIAREAMPGSVWIDFFWPIFGLGVFSGALLATRIPASGDKRYLLAGCYLVQALGIGATVLSPNLAGFAIGSLLLGLPFTAITFFAMQEVRRLRPAAVASTMGLLTAAYGLGQIVGPPLAALMLRHSRSVGEGFTLSLEIAAGSLLAGALMYGGMVSAYPVKGRALPSPKPAA